MSDIKKICEEFTTDRGYTTSQRTARLREVQAKRREIEALEAEIEEMLTYRWDAEFCGDENLDWRRAVAHEREQEERAAHFGWDQ